MHAEVPSCDSPSVICNGLQNTCFIELANSLKPENVKTLVCVWTNSSKRGGVRLGKLVAVGCSVQISKQQ